MDEKLDLFFNILKCAAKVNLALGFILRKIQVGGFRIFDALENNTLLDRSQLVCTKVDLTKLKYTLNKTDRRESCSQGRMNTKWKFYKLTNLTEFAALLKDILMGCNDVVLPKITHSTVAPSNKIQNSHIKATYAFFVLLLSFLHRKQKLRWTQPKFLTYSWVEWMNSTLVSSKKSIWKTFQVLKVCWYSVFFPTISIFEKGALLKMISFNGVSRNTRILSEGCDIKIIHVTWATSTQPSNIFVPPIVTLPSTEHRTWNNIWLHAVNEWKISIRGTYIKS